jgi:hypothetical protein
MRFQCHNSLKRPPQPTTPSHLFKREGKMTAKQSRFEELPLIYRDLFGEDLRRQKKVSRLYQNPAWRGPAKRDPTVYHSTLLLLLHTPKLSASQGYLNTLWNTSVLVWSVVGLQLIVAIYFTINTAQPLGRPANETADPDTPPFEPRWSAHTFIQFKPYGADSEHGTYSPCMPQAAHAKLALAMMCVKCRTQVLRIKRCSFQDNTRDWRYSRAPQLVLAQGSGGL